MKKGLILVIAMAMAFCIGIGATLAYLYVQTDPVVNTFVYGDINIRLDEADVNDEDGDSNKTERVASQSQYKMIPGSTLTKDPTVTVLVDSEACWLFVEIAESENFDQYMSYAIADGWTFYNSDKNGSDIDTDGADHYFIYRKVNNTLNAEKDATYPILSGNCVNVRNSVLKTDLEGLTDTTKPSITFIAYAVQSDNVPTVEEAKALIATQGAPINP